jgi:hypothetical protein
MNNFVRRAVLSAAFTSLAFVAGCTGKKSEPQMAEQNELAEAKATIALKAGQLFASRGEKITYTESCQQDDSRMTTFHCNYGTENTGGVVYDRRVYENGATSLESCGYNPANPAKHATDRIAEQRFLEDAKEKFRQLGFATLGTLASPEQTQFQSAQACLREVTADFLLRSDGRLYTAKFHEALDEAGSNPDFAQVEDIKPIAPNAARASKR